MSYYRHSDNAEDIAKEMLKNGVKGGFYFIHGDENFIKVHYAKAIAERNIAPDFMDFNLRRFDGATLTMESLKDAVEAVPLFSEYTAVLVHDLNISKMDSVILMDTTLQAKEKTTFEFSVWNYINTNDYRMPHFVIELFDND